MMKIQIILLSSFLLAATTTACSDFLTENPKGRLTPENYFTSQEELDMAVNAHGKATMLPPILAAISSMWPR